MLNRMTTTTTHRIHNNPATMLPIAITSTTTTTKANDDHNDDAKCYAAHVLPLMLLRDALAATCRPRFCGCVGAHTSSAHFAHSPRANAFVMLPLSRAVYTKRRCRDAARVFVCGRLPPLQSLFWVRSHIVGFVGGCMFAEVLAVYYS